jgi:hypothetical protein
MVQIRPSRNRSARIQHPGCYYVCFRHQENTIRYYAKNGLSKLQQTDNALDRHAKKAECVVPPDSHFLSAEIKEIKHARTVP